MINSSWGICKCYGTCFSDFLDSKRFVLSRADTTLPSWSLRPMFRLVLLKRLYKDLRSHQAMPWKYHMLRSKNPVIIGHHAAVGQMNCFTKLSWSVAFVNVHSQINRLHGAYPTLTVLVWSSRVIASYCQTCGWMDVISVSPTSVEGWEVGMQEVQYRHFTCLLSALHLRWRLLALHTPPSDANIARQLTSRYFVYFIIYHVMNKSFFTTKIELCHH